MITAVRPACIAEQGKHASDEWLPLSKIPCRVTPAGLFRLRGHPLWIQLAGHVFSDADSLIKFFHAGHPAQSRSTAKALNFR